LSATVRGAILRPAQSAFSGENMRRIILPLVAAVALSALVPSEASAWYCRATSATGTWGTGWSAYRSVANRIALVNCAARTPRGVMCWTRACVP